jgi:hypothetical protein
MKYRKGKKKKLWGFFAGSWWLMPVIFATWQAEIGSITVQGQARQIVQETPPISKITTAKQTGRVAQVAECLLCKYEALSSKS